MKVIKKGIKRAILFYFDEDTKVPRMVMFGELDELMPFYFTMMKEGFKRLQDIIKGSRGKKNASMEDMLEMIRNTRPNWMKDNHSAIGEKSKMSLIYEIKPSIRKDKKVK